MPRALAPLVLVPLLTACAPLPEPAPLPVVGDPQDLSILVGEWWGEYSSTETGRDGRIRFSLAAERGEARGDVLMFADASALEDRGGSPQAALGGRTLAIRFVRLRPEDETVTGTLEPYLDPDCDCLVTTTFTGRASRDAIEGTYETRGGDDYRPTGGRWRVERRAAAETAE